jgi:hypothetical protein
MLKKTAIILAAMAMSVAGVQAGVLIPDCGYAKYGESAGVIGEFSAITSGDKCYGNFSIIDSATSDPFASPVTVGADFIGGNGILTFTSGGFHVDSGVLDLRLRFTVTVMDGFDFFITSIGQSLTGELGNAPGAMVRIEEGAWASFWGFGHLGNSTVTLPGDFEDPVGEGIDQLILSSAVKHVWIQKDIRFAAGTCPDDQTPCTTGASATTFTQVFYQTPGDDLTDIPEPATMLLLSTALLGLGYMRRKRS